MLNGTPKGNYRFLSSGTRLPFCNAVIAEPGYEIVRATLEHSLPYEDGFELIEKHLYSVGRPREALCDVELRCSEPYTVADFLAFNKVYAALLAEWHLYDPSSSIGCTARTNIAPTQHAPIEQVLYAFAYTVPSEATRPTFIVSGATITQDELSLSIAQKVAVIMRTLNGRLNELGVGWEQTTETFVYAPNNIEDALHTEVLPGIGEALLNGLRWFPSLAPIQNTEIELGTQGVLHDFRITC